MASMLERSEAAARRARRFEGRGRKCSRMHLHAAIPPGTCECRQHVVLGAIREGRWGVVCPRGGGTREYRMGTKADSSTCGCRSPCAALRSGARRRSIAHNWAHKPPRCEDVVRVASLTRRSTRNARGRARGRVALCGDRLDPVRSGLSLSPTCGPPQRGHRGDAPTYPDSRRFPGEWHGSTV